jgi:hypothetical protein
MFLPTKPGKLTMEFSEELEETIPPPDPRKYGRKTRPGVRYDEEYSTLLSIQFHIMCDSEMNYILGDKT